MPSTIDSKQFKKYLPGSARIWIALALILVPGVYVILIGTAVLAAAAGAALCYFLYMTFFSGKSLFFRYGHGSILLFSAGFGVCGGVFAVLRAVFMTFRSIKRFEPGCLFELQQEPKLEAYIKEICTEMNVKPPDSVLFHAMDDFFVTSGKLETFNGRTKGRVLSISYPLLGVISKKELRAILVHEFAHLKGWDTIYTTSVLPVYIGTGEALDKMVETFDNQLAASRGLYRLGTLASYVPMLIPKLALRFYLLIFRLIDMKVHRMRELRADAFACALCGTGTVRRALERVYQYGPAFHAFQNSFVLGGIDAGKANANFYGYFRESADDVVEQLGEALEESNKGKGSLLDSHPILDKRLASLPEFPDSGSEDSKAMELIEATEQYDRFLTRFHIRELDRYRVFHGTL